MNSSLGKSKYLKTIVAICVAYVAAFFIVISVWLGADRLVVQNTTVYGDTTMRVAKEYRRSGTGILDKVNELYRAGEAKIAFVHIDGADGRYEVVGDKDGEFRLTIPSGRYRVFVTWGEEGGLFSQKYSFEVQIDGWSKNLNVGTHGFEDSFLTDGRSNFKFGDQR